MYVTGLVSHKTIVLQYHTCTHEPVCMHRIVWVGKIPQLYTFRLLMDGRWRDWGVFLSKCILTPLFTAYIVYGGDPWRSPSVSNSFSLSVYIYLGQGIWEVPTDPHSQHGQRRQPSHPDWQSQSIIRKNHCILHISKIQSITMSMLYGNDSNTHVHGVRNL